MRNTLRIFLIILASLGVSILGYYAYSIATDTLQFPFVGQEHQSGYRLSFAVAKPSFLSYVSSGAALDRDALIGAIRRDGLAWNPTVSAEGSVTVSGEYVDISVANLPKDTKITIDKDVYNDTKKTEYRLSRSLALTVSDTPKLFSIAASGLPSLQEFSVDMYGYPGLTLDDIRWYMMTDSSRICDISESWDSSLFQPVDATRIMTKTQGQQESGRYRVDYDSRLPYVCLIAGIGGDFVTVVDRSLDEFISTGSVVSMLSPEYDLQTEIEFRFSHDIFADTGALYSDAYVENRHLKKIDILKSLDISPNVTLTDDQIVLTPDKITLLGRFEEGIEYTLRLRNITDIYGNQISPKFVFTPISEPFLSIGLPSRRMMFVAGEDISAKMYALKTPQDTYTMKLCRISLEGYSRAERLISEGGNDGIDTLYSMIDGGDDTSECTKSDITIPADSYIAPFRLQDMYESGELSPGLYILAPKEKSVATGFDKIVVPRVFAVVDTQLTMKVDASGNMDFLVTDISTGAPRPDQTVKINKNILRTHTDTWDSTTGISTREYLPFTNKAFATGVLLGKTSSDGTLSTQKDALTEDDYSPPYGLMYEGYYDYEGQYQSFVASASGDGHFGYVVSTWNDGITGWNFGMKDSDYSWETRGRYMAYIHTDRRLYLKGEKVYIHAIVRENNTSLTIPTTTSFTIKVTDPLGADIATSSQIPNEFGTLSYEFDIPTGAHLGSYFIQIAPTDESMGRIENGYTNFQVEVFKNPTFTAEVKLKSSDIEGDLLLNLRKKTNTDPETPWYPEVYKSTFFIDGIVRARYYNGAQMQGIPFSYRIYRAPYYDASDWSDCFWGCYWEPTPEFYTEGTGSIDHDGIGVFRSEVAFSSYYDDYVYTAEVTITDPLTGENIVTPSTLLARIPVEYKAFDPYNPLIFTPEQKILTPGDMLSGSLDFSYGKWDTSLKNKYRYELIHREYSRMIVDDLRVRDTPITDQTDSVVLSGSLVEDTLTLSTVGLAPGEYHIRIIPITAADQSAPDTSISDTLIYIVGDFIDQNSSLRVIPEKTVYGYGDIARVFITSPFSGGYIYLTRERGGVLDHEYIQMTGSTLVREYNVDDSFYPNVYIGAVAYASGYTPGNRNYAVGYAEIVTDLSDKKANLQIAPDKPVYKNRDTVNLDLKFTNKNNEPLLGEISVMVVDESLIRLLGNIDLDIVPKFFRKHPFTLKTALTMIGMERNRFLSRKGSNGGSGDKGGGGEALSSRSLFRNTAYYNPSLLTNTLGEAQISFDLPDNVTDYRIIAIGQTKSSEFAVSQETIPVRRDYTLETHVPYIAYKGDTFVADFTAFNSTKKITNATIDVVFGSGASEIKQEYQVILQALSADSVHATIPVSDAWLDEVEYTISLREGDTLLDSITRTLTIPDVPLLQSVTRRVGVLTGSTQDIALTALTRNTDISRSNIVMNIARSPLTNPTSVLESLIAYPYGCIEQTISSTLPNAIALRFSRILGVTLDTTTAEKNLQDGITKILRMQTYGGWKYWESDYQANQHVTPYVIRSLYLFKDLGVEIPQSSIDEGVRYMIDTLDYNLGTSTQDIDYRSEIFATLARGGHPRAELMIAELDKAYNSVQTGGLSPHGKLMYIQGLQYLGKLQDEKLSQVREILDKSPESSYWYWDNTADRAILASLYLDRGDAATSTLMLDDLVHSTDMRSYYVSTQAKTQILLSLLKQAQTLGNPRDIALKIRSDGFIAGLTLRNAAYSDSLDIRRDIVGDSIEITRNDSLSPVFYELLEYNTPKDILQMQPKSSGGMYVSRRFEKVDETRGLDSAGNWIITEPLEQRVFKKGQLYKVILTVEPPKRNNPGYYLTLEDFVPGAWRPIRGVFDTESQFTTDNQYNTWNGWSHVESLDTRILATADVVWSTQPQTYTYYIRPEYSGKYLLPPVTAYYMYQPEIHAIGTYERIEVED